MRKTRLAAVCGLALLILSGAAAAQQSVTVGFPAGRDMIGETIVDPVLIIEYEWGLHAPRTWAVHAQLSAYGQHDQIGLGRRVYLTLTPGRGPYAAVYAHLVRGYADVIVHEWDEEEEAPVWRSATASYQGGLADGRIGWRAVQTQGLWEGTFLDVYAGVLLPFLQLHGEAARQIQVPRFWPRLRIGVGFSW